MILASSIPPYQKVCPDGSRSELSSLSQFVKSSTSLNCFVVLLIAHGGIPFPHPFCQIGEKVVFWTPSLVMPFPPTLHQVMGEQIMEMSAHFPQTVA